MLHDDRHVADQHRGVVGTDRHGAVPLQLVEPLVQGAARGDGDPVGAGRFPVREEERDLHVGVLVTGVQQARRLVARHRLRAGAGPGDASLGDRPHTLTDVFHGSAS
ncbi:hypothetical protein GCM10010508_49850 [Streptomyces naganishii JCM 4654]|uniref:Uncharacterized protein n=1 Tax=Streptomyces naganishii JCM 4654 TaxID=1306179 RepID=A0A918Y858_9ACTN|nr:hypothetical protein GCM10010508_49850 [Streptomyces naganishii JCM 4654]